MKALNYLLILIFSQILVVDGFAQEYREKEIVKDGEIVFVKYKKWGDHIYYQRADAENLVPQSYSGAGLMTPNVNHEEIEKEFFQEIFSREKVKSLPPGKLICQIKYNAVKEEIAYVEFMWLGENDMPFTLKELDLLERRLKSYPFIYYGEKKEIINSFSPLMYPIIFSRIYKD